MAKNGKHGYLSHFGTMRHWRAKPDLASGRRGRGFESRRLDYLAGATGNADFIGVSGSFYVPAKAVLSVLLLSINKLFFKAISAT